MGRGLICETMTFDLNRQRRTLRTWVLVLLALLVGGSFIPLRWKVWIGAHGQYHLKVHFAVFVICALLGCLSMRNPASRVALCVALMLLAAAIEAAQSRFFGNRFEVADLRADLAGTACALAITEVLTRRRNNCASL